MATPPRDRGEGAIERGVRYLLAGDDSALLIESFKQYFQQRLGYSLAHLSIG